MQERPKTLGVQVNEADHDSEMLGWSPQPPAVLTDLRPMALFRLLCLVPVTGWHLAACSVSSRMPLGVEGPRRDQCAWNVCIRSDDDQFGRTYIARNEEPVPATVTLTFSFVRNLWTPEDGRVQRVIPPNSTERIYFHRQMPGSLSANLSVAIDLGSSSTEPDDYVYSVPFGGSAARPLIQGFDGDETHMGAMQYALDIAMPPNTPVFAARDGVVLYIQDGFTEGGTDPALLERANIVVVAQTAKPPNQGERSRKSNQDCTIRHSRR